MSNGSEREPEVAVLDHVSNPENIVTEESLPEQWLNPDIIPFTRQHEVMLTEVHAAITGAAKLVEQMGPQLLPMLGSLGIQL